MMDLASSPVLQPQATVVGGRLRLSLFQAGLAASVLCVVGCFAVYSTFFSLWNMWVDDPLKSVGGFVPLISLVLVLRVWRSLGWEMEGTWWGLVLLAATVALVHLRDVAILELVLSPSWSIFLPPHSLVAVAYGAGAVLLFGGRRLLWKAKFPVAFLWLVNPVPNYFSVHIDLPLQHLSSAVARGFAQMLGQHLTPDQLLLMFTPKFGMFIAPGCNGIRGAVTMGLIALVAGYLYQFKPQVIAAVVAGAVLLGYVFNLARLCALVLYYIVALHVPWLQTRAEMGDYIIGACLFFFATTLLFTLIQKLGPTGDIMPPSLSQQGPDPHTTAAPTSFYLRWVALLVLAVAGSVSYARVILRNHGFSAGQYDASRYGVFPESVGNFHLVRRWDETMVTGAVVFYEGAYRDQDGTEVSIGVSPVLGAHDTLLCHAARGEDWTWHGNLPLPSRTGEVGFSGSFYSEGPLQYMEATTVCTGGSCGQYSSDRRNFGLVYSLPKTDALLSPDPARPIPVMLRAQTTDQNLSVADAQKLTTKALRAFLSGADLQEFTRPYRVQTSF